MSNHFNLLNKYSQQNSSLAYDDVVVVIVLSTLLLLFLLPYKSIVWLCPLLVVLLLWGFLMQLFCPCPMLTMIIIDVTQRTDLPPLPPFIPPPLHYTFRSAHCYLLLLSATVFCFIDTLFLLLYNFCVLCFNSIELALNFRRILSNLLRCSRSVHTYSSFIFKLHLLFALFGVFSFLINSSYSPFELFYSVSLPLRLCVACKLTDIL